jgi:hypothetical protein
MVNKQMDEPREVAEYHDRWKGQKPA